MIGIFDSGIAGLAVLDALKHGLPGHDIVFLGDTAHGPYEDRSPESVTALARRNLERLMTFGIDVIVIACPGLVNCGLEGFQQRFRVPVFNLIGPAVEAALAVSSTLRFGIIGSRYVVENRLFEKKIVAEDPHAVLHSVAAPLLIPLLEEGWGKHPATRMILKKYLQPLKMRQIDTLVLGGVHLSLIGSLIGKKMGKRVSVIDPVKTLVEHLRQVVGRSQEKDHLVGTCRLYVTALDEQILRVSRSLFSGRFSLELLDESGFQTCLGH